MPDLTFTDTPLRPESILRIAQELEDDPVADFLADQYYAAIKTARAAAEALHIHLAQTLHAEPTVCDIGGVEQLEIQASYVGQPVPTSVARAGLTLHWAVDDGAFAEVPDAELPGWRFIAVRQEDFEENPGGYSATVPGYSAENAIQRFKEDLLVEQPFSGELEVGDEVLVIDMTNPMGACEDYGFVLTIEQDDIDRHEVRQGKKKTAKTIKRA